jgi:hypothetical protein
MNTLLISSSPVFEAESYLSVTKDPKWHDERCFFFIVNGEADLMIVQIGAQKQQ